LIGNRPLQGSASMAAMSSACNRFASTGANKPGRKLNRRRQRRCRKWMA
jgi:hypothetical protein